MAGPEVTHRDTGAPRQASPALSAEGADGVPVSDQRMRQRALLSLSTFSDADVCGRGNTLQKRSVSSPAAPAPRHHPTVQHGHACPIKTTA